MARRRYQRGSLVPTKGLPKDGIWRARWYEDVIVNGEVTRPYKQEVIGTTDEYPTRRLAERRLEEVLRPINSRFYRATQQRTFKQVAEMYLQESVKLLNPSVQASEKSRISRHLVPFFGAKFAHEIHAGDTRNFISSSKANPKTMKNLINLMRQIHKLALAHNCMTKEVDWFGDVKLPKVPKRKMPFFERAEILRIIQNADGLLKTFYWILGETGIRLGECCGLKTSAISLNPSAVIVECSAWQGKIGGTKTGRTRVFPISGLLADHLKPILESKPFGAYLFATRNGTPWNGNDLVTRELKPLLERLVIKPGMADVGAHAFRHGNISIMIQEHFSAKVIQDRAGHSNFERLSLDRYGHATSEDHISAAEKLGRVFATAIQ